MHRTSSTIGNGTGSAPEVVRSICRSAGLTRSSRAGRSRSSNASPSAVSPATYKAIEILRSEIEGGIWTSAVRSRDCRPERL